MHFVRIGKSLEDEKPPWQKSPPQSGQKTTPKFEVDLEEEEESEVSVSVPYEDDGDVEIVSERLRPKAKLRANRARSSRDVENDEMESLAPLKRKRQSHEK